MAKISTHEQHATMLFYLQRVHAELYGPLMIIFTLIALLLFEMKISDHVVVSSSESCFQLGRAWVTRCSTSVAARRNTDGNRVRNVLRLLVRHLWTHVGFGVRLQHTDHPHATTIPDCTLKLQSTIFILKFLLSFVSCFHQQGYALFGHCVVIFLGTVLHTDHDHAMFYLMWSVLGGLSSLRMVTSHVQGLFGWSCNWVSY